MSFIQAVANVLGAVVARAREEQLEAQLQQSRRLESVGKLAGGVAHDFNNLLAVILNYADFALEAATDDAQRRDLEELSKAATRGAELVRQLLAFSRRRPVDAVALDLAEVVRDMEPMLRRTIGEHIDLRCWVASELPPTVIDPSQVTQLLMNLTVNARDAMPDGGRLTIQATEFENGVRLIVEDTGAGMSEDTVAKAFDPFFTTKPPGSGTGLGLATVYGIVSQAGGTVSLDSELGRGTRATIDLPAREPLYPPTPPRERAAASARASARPSRRCRARACTGARRRRRRAGTPAPRPAAGCRPRPTRGAARSARRATPRSSQSVSMFRPITDFDSLISLSGLKRGI